MAKLPRMKRGVQVTDLNPPPGMYRNFNVAIKYPAGLETRPTNILFYYL
ncbi:MAG: hypothetical protein E3K37_12710 [Candidatus Kuenenia sp.]|nr:hypothetical protein [Candidatus Kuenenia hertensis]